MVKRINKDTFTYTVNNILYTVNFIQGTSLDKEGNEVKSIIVYKDRSIYIDSTISAFNQKHCLTHEITHSVIYETQLCPIINYSEEHLCELVALYGGFIVKIANSIIRKRRKI